MKLDEIKDIINTFENTDLNELELTMEDTTIRLSRGAGVVADGVVPSYRAPAAGVVPVGPVVAESGKEAPESVSAQKEQEQVSAEAEGTIVVAPIVGTFYASSAPDKPPYVKVGDIIEEGATLCIIEAMKFMNEVPCEKGGRVAEILVQDGDFVEFGQPLFRIV